MLVDREQNLISGNLQLNTPEGPIRFSFSVRITEGADIASHYLSRLLTSPPNDNLVQKVLKPYVLSERKIQLYEERRKHDQIFALVPLEDTDGETTRVVNALRRAKVTSVEALAALSDQELSSNGIFGNRGIKTYNYIHHLRELAQTHLKQIRPQSQS